MIKAIYFDLDNTLVHRIKSIEVYAAEFYKDFAQQLVEASVEDIITIITIQDNGGYLAKDSPYKTVKEAVSKTLYQQLNWHHKPAIEELETHWHDRFPLYSVAMQGANELLEMLSEQGFYIGIISNGAHDTRLARAETLMAYSKVNKLVSSESAGINKPAKEIFINTITEAGLKPEECCYVGDHPINDIEGSRNAGLKTIWIKGFHDWPKDTKPADHSIEHLSEIIDLLALFNTREK